MKLDEGSEPTGYPEMVAEGEATTQMDALVSDIINGTPNKCAEEEVVEVDKEEGEEEAV